MEGMKHVIDSAEQCAENIVNKEPGAGANAASAAEMVVITTSPLSELIWIPQEGLSIKYADSRKAERKASFMWKAESFNMIISTSQCANAGECSTSRDHIAGDSTVQLNQSSHVIADPAAFLAPPQPHSLIRLHQQDTRPSEEKNLVKDRDGADTDINQSVKNVENPYTQRSTECFDTICPAKEVVNRIQSSILPPGPNPHLAQTRAGFASTSGVLNEHHKEKARIQVKRKSVSIALSGSHDSGSEKSDKSSSSVGSTGCKHADLALDSTVDDDVEKLKNPACLPVHGGQNSFADDFNVAVLSQEMGEAETPHDNIKKETGKFRSLSPYNVYPGNMEKGKEKVLYDDKDSNSSSKDTSESVESSSCQRLVSKGKRAFSFDLKISEGCKRRKKENNGTTGSKSLIRNDSSFINWISTITSKLSRYDQDMISSPLLPPSYNNMKENFGSVRTSHEKRDGGMCKTVGFNTFFQALYCPNFMLPDATTDDGHQREASTSKHIKIIRDQYNYSGNHMPGNFFQFNLDKTYPMRSKQIYNGLKEIHLTSQALAVSRLRIVCDEDSGKSHDQVSPSCERHNQVTWHADDFPSMRFNMSSSRQETCEKLKRRNSQVCALKNMNAASSSARKDFLCTDEREYRALSSDPKNPANAMLNNKNNFFQNLWITRFLQKVSSPILNSVRCNLSINDNHPLSKEENPRKSHIPTPLESESEPDGKHPISLSFPCVLKKLDSQTLKPRISPTMPSEGLKKMALGQLEASCSRKRSHFNPSKMHGHTASRAPITCFFCGNGSHNLRECPELAETDLLDFRDFMDSYDGKNISSCFCLRCFQADHWAISCPRASSRIKRTTGSSFDISHGSFHMIEEKPESHNLPNYIGKKNLWFRDSRYKLYKLSERGDTEDSQAESMVKTKQKASSSTENESRSNQFIPFYNSIVPDVASGQNRIFKAVRRLRLSRTNLIRWMKSTNTSCSLEGFFVRLRLGKWEKGPGGTGYQVARIISASRENHLSVKIGNLKCSLEFCFVSNQDYMEEELKAWLTTTLEGGGILPSMEELNKKFKEREELGL